MRAHERFAKYFELFKQIHLNNLKLTKLIVDNTKKLMEENAKMYRLLLGEPEKKKRKRRKTKID
jgi:hypothetical protein